MLSMQLATPYPKAAFSKRLFDIAAAAFGLAVLAAPLAAIALAVKLDSPGPVLFRQIRVGRFGMPFRILKFRTMIGNGAVISAITTAPGDNVTRVGRFLRATKFDELPQLFNVLVGQMSIVGPRPEIPDFVAKYPDEDKRVVLSVRPGLTDFASIFYRNESELLASQSCPLAYYERVVMPAKLAYCRFYVHRASLRLDFFIIALTLFALATDTFGGNADSFKQSSGRWWRPRWARALNPRRRF